MRNFINLAELKLQRTEMKEIKGGEDAKSMALPMYGIKPLPLYGIVPIIRYGIFVKN